MFLVLNSKKNLNFERLSSPRSIPASFLLLLKKLLNMKRILPLVLFGFLLSAMGTGLQAQNKIGYISLQELIPAMPEFKKAEADLADYGKALNEQLNEYRRTFDREDSIFKADSAKMSAATREVKRKNLNELAMKVYTFQNEAQQMLQKKESELIVPIQQKAVQTTQAVAKENGYSYILSKDQLIHFPTTDDVLPLVAKKLGLKLEAPAAAAAPPKPTGK
jgi:outer membrane protein